MARRRIPGFDEADIAAIRARVMGIFSHRKEVVEKVRALPPDRELPQMLKSLPVDKGRTEKPRVELSLEDRKRQEFESVMARLERKQARERGQGLAASYIVKRMHLDGSIY